MKFVKTETRQRSESMKYYDPKKRNETLLLLANQSSQENMKLLVIYYLHERSWKSDELTLQSMQKYNLHTIGILHTFLVCWQGLQVNKNCN